MKKDLNKKLKIYIWIQYKFLRSMIPAINYIFNF